MSVRCLIGPGFGDWAGVEGVLEADYLMVAVDAGYSLIGILILVVMVLGAGILFVTHALPKAKRHGYEKESTYESGMEVIGDARQRFNVRFYLVAMLFLLFDVELVFMYPWALVFTKGAGAPASAENLAGQQFLFVEMGIFFAILLVGYAYAWKKGVFRWD